MRQWRPIRAVAFIMAASIAACGAEQAQPKLKLSLNFKKGECYVVDFGMSQKITQEINKQKMLINQAIGMNYAMDVTDVDAKGNYIVKLTFRATKFNQSMGTTKVSYDSAKPPEKIPPAAVGFAALVDQSLDLTMAPSGKVLEVIGTDEMLDKIVAKATVILGNKSEELEKALKDQFSAAKLKQQIETSTEIYPDKPVGVGDSWSKTVDIDGVMSMQLDNTWTLKSRKAGIAKVALDTKIRTSPDANPMKLGTMNVGYELSGTQTGEIAIDEATGMPTVSTLKQDITGQIKADNAPGMAPGTTWPITIKSGIKITCKKEQPKAE